MAKATKKKTIWIGIIPDIFGYGMSVAGETEEECLKALKRAYRDWSKDRSDDYGDMRDENGRKLTRFEKAMESWGGRVDEVELGKLYWDNFGN
jgi:predicted RNase H-like HicB family nuclease